MIPQDNTFADLMRKSKLEMPFSDFEDNLMRRIEIETKSQKSIQQDFRLSLLFFLLGTGFGGAACLFLPQVLSSIIEIPALEITWGFQALFVVTFLWQLEKLLYFLRAHRRL